MIRVLLLAAALLLPSRIGLLDGVPLDGPVEFALLLVLLPVLCSRGLRARVGEALGPRGRPAATAALAGALVLKLVLLAAGPNAAFESCYRSTLVQPPVGACEASFADPLRLSGGSRLDERLDFGGVKQNPAAGALLGRIWLRDGPLPASDWNLSFFNAWRMNWPTSPPGLPDRNRMPFELEARGEVDTGGGPVTVDYTGSGSLRIGDRRVELPPSYEGIETVRVVPDAGRQPFALDYGYRRVARTDEPPEPTYAHLSVRGPDAEPLAAAGAGAGWRALSVLADGLLLAAGLALAGLFAWLLRSRWWLAAGLAPGLALAAAVESPQAVLGLNVPASAPYAGLAALLLAALAWRPGPHPLLAGWAGLAAIAAVRLLDEFPYWDSVLYPNGGDDPLLYESMASEILATGSLEGQEKVFEFQPGFRYLLFGARLLLGPAAPPLSLMALAALGMGVLFLVHRLGTPYEGPAPARVAAVAAGALMIGVLWSDSLVGQMRAMNSEWTTWILMPFGAALLLAGRDRTAQLAGALLLGVEAVVRLNQLPLVLALFALFVIGAPAGARRRALAVSAAGLALLLLPLAHNVVYGGQWKLLTSGAASVNEPGELLDVGSDTHRRDKVADQLTRAFYLPPAAPDPGEPDQRVGDLKLLVGSLELLWLGAAAAALMLRRRIGAVALAGLALPLAALLPYALYDPTSYYPRHVVIGWLAMGVAVLLVCRASGRGEAEASGSGT